MQKVKLPQQIDPVKSAVKRSDYVGVIATKDLSRFTEAVSSCSDVVDVTVKFAKDAQGLTFFHGNMATDTTLICQRCNGELAHRLDIEFCFSPVQRAEDAELDELPEVYEPVEVNEYGEIDLFQLLEDELILALPIVPLHAEEQCPVKQNDLSFGQIAEEETRKNPFAVLKELKRDQE
ncbi:23S rRNA accumulation protein YceD [Alteromonas oceanisediminis]|uniref:23S rRNA accumulation protein YceD n=1 Tax=Alteromonas oceanisediminis TaxID=2836180 RepID=UPI001BD99D2D|nr:23S rRNA accumulation protein YceD [Alteromonas oceanisediminis]MBT0586440.1 23S rRNA accumulation protein YceD [Alteromonas oceanisediminis]